MGAVVMKKILDGKKLVETGKKIKTPIFFTDQQLNKERLVKFFVKQLPPGGIQKGNTFFPKIGEGKEEKGSEDLLLDSKNNERDKLFFSSIANTKTKKLNLLGVFPDA